MTEKPKTDKYFHPFPWADTFRVDDERAMEFLRRELLERFAGRAEEPTCIPDPLTFGYSMQYYYWVKGLPAPPDTFAESPLAVPDGPPNQYVRPTEYGHLNWRVATVRDPLRWVFPTREAAIRWADYLLYRVAYLWAVPLPVYRVPALPCFLHIDRPPRTDEAWRELVACKSMAAACSGNPWPEVRFMFTGQWSCRGHLGSTPQKAFRRSYGAFTSCRPNSSHVFEPPPHGWLFP